MQPHTPFSYTGLTFPSYILYLYSCRLYSPCHIYFLPFTVIPSSSFLVQSITTIIFPSPHPSLHPHLLPSYKPHHFPSHKFSQSAFLVPLRLVQPDTYLSLPCSPSFIPRTFSFSRTSHFLLSSFVPSSSSLRPHAFPSLDPSHFRILHTEHSQNLLKYSSCIPSLMPHSYHHTLPDYTLLSSHLTPYFIFSYVFTPKLLTHPLILHNLSSPLNLLSPYLSFTIYFPSLPFSPPS